MTLRRAGSLGALVLASVLVWSPAGAQQGRCASCHFDDFSKAEGLQRPTEGTHLDEWELSAHSLAGVGCNACHGGDPDATDLADAHRTVLSTANPASSVYLPNIPETCGSCHTGQLEAFKTSRHAGLIATGDYRAPTCITCHGSAGARLPSTRGISNRCAACHVEGGAAPVSEHHELVRVMRERIQENRYSLSLVREAIENTRNEDRRVELVRLLEDAMVPLGTAVEAWHAFDFDRATEPLAQAEAQIGELMEQLAARP